MLKFNLSSSALTLFLDCPRCFWFEKVKKIKRPRGIFPSLPSGMDRVIKTYFDVWRAKDALPKELSGELFKGVKLFADQTRLDEWRNWRTGLEYHDENGSSLIGALDDLLTLGNCFIPFDYKTKGSPTNEESAVKYYQKQLDCYALLLESNGLKTAGYGFLIYYSPKGISEKGEVLFETQTIKIATDSKRAQQIFRNACKSLQDPQPEAGLDCEYCGWLSQTMGPTRFPDPQLHFEIT